MLIQRLTIQQNTNVSGFRRTIVIYLQAVTSPIRLAQVRAKCGLVRVALTISLPLFFDFNESLLGLVGLLLRSCALPYCDYRYYQ
jgi:hypothetical protein